MLSVIVSCKTVPETPVVAEGDEEEEYQPLLLPPEGRELPVSVFGEIWGYVVAGREAALQSRLPLSDVGYFGAEVDAYGSLVTVPSRKNLPAYKGRVHLVVACNGRALSHFALVPGSAERKKLVADLLAAAKDYDGLQIDFESIPQRDGETFFSFLAELRAGLGNKIFSVALPARIKKVSNDVYDYEKIAPIADRILIMAYDEHWSTSDPGPIASLAWCRKVAAYCMGVIGSEKLIMGLPFYGRGWSSANHSQAYVYTQIERIIRENNITDIKRENGIPTFNYTATVNVKVYYEDEYSLSVRMEMYKAMGVSSIGFWRVGQETPGIWKLLSLEN